jgi:GAF domain-containing protein
MSRPQPAAAVEAYRAALARLTPVVGATFASVFLRDPEQPDRLRLACAQNWPQSSARYLGDMRIREGLGPTGRAVRTGLPVVVPDVFRDPALEEWRVPAREMGFVSMIAIPIAVMGEVVGAASFYFDRRRAFGDEVDGLVDLVTKELAGAATGLNSSRSGPGPGSR